MMKRCLKSLLFCLLLGSLLLAGCTPAASDSPGGSSVTDQGGGDTPVVDGGVLTDFTAETLDGSTVDSSLFIGHPVTMINVWATFCGPCLKEMPDLGALAAEYAGKNVQIVGLLSDVRRPDGSYDTETLELASDIVEGTGAAYPHLLPSDDLIQGVLMNVQVVPTTFFVDETGAQIGSVITGARSADQWRDILNEVLAESAP